MARGAAVVADRPSQITVSRPMLQQALSAPAAASFLSISETYFRQLVGEKKLPRPRVLGTRRLWDVDELAAAFKALPQEGDAPENDLWAKFDAEHGL